MKEHHSEETKENILDAAMEYFAKYGYRGASLSKIAEEAKVSKSLIFWYFENKEALFQALLDRFLHECLHSLERKSPKGNAKVKIEILIDTYWEFIKANFKFVRIFLNWFMELDEEKKEKAKNLKNIHERFKNIFKDYLKEGIKEGIFRKDLDIDITSFYLISCLEGILLQILINNIPLETMNQSFFINIKKNLLLGLLQ